MGKGKLDAWRCGHCLRTAAWCRRRGASPVCDGCRASLAARGLKFCRGCQRPHPLARFQRVSRGEERRALCNACLLAAHGERRRLYMQRYWLANRERRTLYMRAYRARHPEQTKRHARATYINRKMRESARLRAGGAAS